MSLNDEATDALTVSKGLTLLASCLRKYAQQLPYDPGVWTLYRIVEVRAQWTASEASSLAAAASLVVDGSSSSSNSSSSGGAGAAPSRLAASSFTYSSYNNYVSNHSFRRAILRTHAVHPSSAPLLMLMANESMLSRSSFKFALCAYSEVLRMRPNEPVSYLGMGVSELTHAQSRTAQSRYTHAMRAALFLARYVQLRGKEEELRTGSSSSSSSSSSGLSAEHDSSLAAPLNLPRALRAAECAFNIGRAAHQLGLTPLAMHSYRQALWEGGRVDRQPAGASTGELRALEAYGPLDIRREAAYNLVLLLKEAGDYGEALRLTQQHLTY
jgi:hypothetical protein